MAGATAAHEPVPYPEGWEADVVLRDGETAHIRPITPADAHALQAFHVAQSERSTYMRFFAALERLPDRDLTRFTTVDHVNRVALIAVRTVRAEPARAEALEEDASSAAEAGESDEQIIGVARFDRITEDEAEVAFNIADAHHGRGLGSVLLEHLTAAAREVGVRRFTAEVLPQNGRMLAVFREAGYEVSQTVDDGVVTVVFDIDPTDRSLAVTADREHRAEARSMQRLLGARTVVLVGAARAPEGSVLDLLTKRAFDSLARSGTTNLHVVGLPETSGHGGLPRQDWWSGPGSAAGEATHVQYWDRLGDVPGEVELAVVALPPADVVAVVRRLGPLGVRSVVVLSTGFAETGDAGLVLQRELVRAAHSVGMRLVGPASFGFFDAAASPPINVSLAEELPAPGRLGLFCQSAPMAVPILASVANRNLGVSSFVSAGHRADVSGNDLMQFWEEDPATEVAGLFLESIGNPRKFSRIARRLAAVKPVVVVTAGQSGPVVPPGHAVRPTRSPRRTIEEVFRQSGVVRADNTHALLDIAQLFALQPLPRGRRVGIVAGSSSMVAIAAEAAVAARLEDRGRVVTFTEDTSDDELARSLAELYSSDACDVVIVVHVPTVGAASPRLARAVAKAAAGSGITTAAVVLGLHGASEPLTAPDADGTPRTVPAYSTPEGAAAALGAVVRYAAWRSADHGRPVAPSGTDRQAARRIIQRHLAASDGDGAVRLSRARPDRAARVLRHRPLARAHGVLAGRGGGGGRGDRLAGRAQEHSPRGCGTGPTWAACGSTSRVPTSCAATCCSCRTAPPRSAPTTRRSRCSAWRRPAWRAWCGRPRTRCSGRSCRSASPGTPSELLGDVGYAIPPLTDVDLADLVRSVRAAPRLFGYRGLPPADVEALEDVIARVSVLARDHPELRTLELHPVVVSEHGAAVLSARVELAPGRRTDASRRSLPA